MIILMMIMMMIMLMIIITRFSVARATMDHISIHHRSMAMVPNESPYLPYYPSLIVTVGLLLLWTRFTVQHVEYHTVAKKLG